MKKILIATEKPFAGVAVKGITDIFNHADFTTILLEKYNDKSELLKAVADVDAMIIRSDKITADVIDAAENLKIIVRAGAGYDNIDLNACNAKKIVAMNTPGQNANAVAELALGMMIYMARKQFNGGSGAEIKGKNLGLYPYGNVSKALANLARGCGMNIYVYAPTKDKAYLESENLIPVQSAEVLFSTCQYVSLHIPTNEKTKKSINYELLSKMKKGAMLINTARKEIINEDDLKKVMEENEIKYISDIAPDCAEEMKEKFGDRFFATPKKQGAQTAEANFNAGLAAAKQIVDFFKNGNTQFQVNTF